MIGVGILGFGTLVSGAQSFADSAGDAGPYFRLGRGSPLFENGWLPGPDVSSNSPAEYHLNPALNSAVGWNFNRNTAAELDLGYAGAGTNSVPGAFPDNATVAHLPLLANVMLSLPLSDSTVVPYLGAGAGGDDMISGSDGFNAGAPSVFRDQNDVVFAWQAFAGLRFKMSERTSFGFGYKYFATGDPTYPSTPNLPAVFDGVRTHSLLLTFQLKF